MEELTQTSNTLPKETASWAKALIAVTGGLGIGICIVSASFLAPALRKYCLPYVPATPAQIENVLSCLPGKPSGKLLDIGSGDGRIVIAAASKGFTSHGVELNGWLVIYSKIMALTRNLNSNTKFYRGDLWKFKLSPYNYIVIFGVEQMMADLQQKIVKEALPNSKIIACRFPLPAMKPEKTIGTGVDTVWLYEVNKG